MITPDLLLFVAIGGVCGFFLKLWLQVAIIIIAVIYYKTASRNDDGTAAHLHLFYWIIFVCVGMVVGNLTYVLLHIPPGFFDFSYNKSLNIKGWFIR